MERYFPIAALFVSLLGCDESSSREPRSDTSTGVPDIAAVDQSTDRDYRPDVPPMDQAAVDGPRDSGPPIASHGTCFAESGKDTVVVKSAAELETAVNAAPAGRQILVAPGTYPGGKLVLSNSQGTKTKPVVIRPQSGIGAVTFASPEWDVTGSRLVISKLRFTKAQITLRGQLNRLTRCRFTEITRDAVVVNAATDLRIDHCDFSDVTGTNNQSPIFFNLGAVAKDLTRRVLIDHNHFHDINVQPGVNGMEIVITSTATGAFWKDPEAVIDHCLFSNIDIGNEGEVISVKNSGTDVRFSTFVNVALYLSQRSASFNEVRSCWFEKMSTRCLNIWGDKHLVIGNRFVGNMHMRVGAGNTDWDTVLAGKPSASGGYAAARDCRVIGNKLDSGKIEVGGYWSSSTPTIPAQNNVIEATSPASAVALIPGREKGTVIKAATSESFVAAVKLTPADVGLSAADPLCK
jgi:hypothetical protein